MVIDIHKKKGVRPKFDIYIGREVSGLNWTYDSKWGNYYYGYLSFYEAHIRDVLWNDLEELRGKKLGCFCVTTRFIEPIVCHGQILMKLLKEKKRKKK